MMIQATTSPRLSEPAIPDVDWAGLYQALTVVESVVSEAVDREVSLAVKARHFVEDAPDEDFTAICLTLRCSASDAFSPAPRIEIVQHPGTPLDCGQFMEQIQNAFFEIGHKWLDMSRDIEKAGRMIQFTSTENPDERRVPAMQ